MKYKWLLVLVILVLIFTACTTAQETTAPAEEAAPVEEAAPEEAAVEMPAAVMVASGALGDSGIFDSGNEGLKRAAADLGVETKVLEGQQDPSLYYDLLKSAAEGYEIVFVNPGYQFTNELTDLAPEYPETCFFYVDGVSDVEGPNISSIKYRENEGSYAAGLMAATMTTRTEIEGINEDKVVGIVGALDIPTINNFIAGFKQGAASVDPEVEVKVLYAGAFDDPAKGKELALSLYEQGADIVYNVAANTGLGVLQAAEEAGLYAIGVDVNQDDYHTGHVMGSMLKQVDNSFYDVIEQAIEGTLICGEVNYFGIAEKGVGMTYSDTMLSIVPEDVIAAMKAADEAIASGKIVVDEVK